MIVDYNCLVLGTLRYIVTLIMLWLAGLIREIRNVSLYVPGFQLCELEEFVYVASTF